VNYQENQSLSYHKWVLPKTDLSGPAEHANYLKGRGGGRTWEADVRVVSVSVSVAGKWRAN